MTFGLLERSSLYAFSTTQSIFIFGLFFLLISINASADQIFKSKEAIDAVKNYENALSNSREDYRTALEAAKKKALVKEKFKSRAQKMASYLHHTATT